MHAAGQTALVTGGAKRIGRAICRELAAHGCNVVIHYHHSVAEAKALARELSGCGVQAATVQGALDTEAACNAVLQTSWKVCGPLDILVNNASIFERQSLSDATAADYERHWRINCLGPICLTRAFARYRANAGMHDSGVVINLLDRRVTEESVDCMPYLLSKKALASFTVNAAKGLTPGIRVNAVAPGAILPAVLAKGATPISEPSIPVFEAKASPEDVACAVLALVESDGVIGRVSYVGGSPGARGV